MKRLSDRLAEVRALRTVEMNSTFENIVEEGEDCRARTTHLVIIIDDFASQDSLTQSELGVHRLQVSLLILISAQPFW